MTFEFSLPSAKEVKEATKIKNLGSNESLKEAVKSATKLTVVSLKEAETLISSVKFKDISSSLKSEDTDDNKVIKIVNAFANPEGDKESLEETGVLSLLKPELRAVYEQFCSEQKRDPLNTFLYLLSATFKNYHLTHTVSGAERGNRWIVKNEDGTSNILETIRYLFVLQSTLPKGSSDLKQCMITLRHYGQQIYQHIEGVIYTNRKSKLAQGGIVKLTLPNDCISMVTGDHTLQAPLDTNAIHVMQFPSGQVMPVSDVMDIASNEEV